MKTPYAILIHSCDAYSDCWDPFFKLMKKHWADNTAPIYLNTEHLDYSYEGVPVIPTIAYKQQPKGKNLSWSERVAHGLSMIEEDYVLYLQEDYFFHSKVRTDYINHFAQLMQNNSDIDCIHLTLEAVLPEDKPAPYEGLKPVKAKQRYRLSLQAALWKKSVLMECLRPYESIWNFEEFGSIRAGILNHNFYVVDENWLSENKLDIMPYIFTGITQSKWNKEVIPLFKENQIEIDYSKRGFIQDSPKKKLSLRIKNKFRRIPVLIKHKKDIRRIKKSLSN